MDALFWEGVFTVNSPVSGRKSNSSNGFAAATDAGEIPADDPRILLVERVAASSGFSRAPRLHSLLLHITSNALAGRTDLLSEAKIGEQVFGRTPDYNRADDSIVRAQMRLLRRKLDSYFAGEGLGEALVITVPTGSYLPHFEPRARRDTGGTGLQAGIVATRPAAARTGRRWMWLAALGAAFLCGLLAARIPAASSRAAGSSAAHPILSRLLDHNRPTLVVVQDADLVVLNTALNDEIQLDEYQSGAYKRRLDDPELNAAHAKTLRFLDERQYTSVGDVSIVRRLFQAVPDSWDQIQVVYPKHLHMRQLKQSNAILIGGGGANPWVQLFDNRLLFRLRRDGSSSQLHVENLHPRAGEPAAYASGQNAYGILALLPQSDGEGRVLIMAGTSLEATEAASELVISPASAARLMERLRREAGPQGFTSFQLVVRTARLGGTSAGTEIVASRVE